jgi:hypothetical protein
MEYVRSAVNWIMQRGRGVIMRRVESYGRFLIAASHMTCTCHALAFFWEVCLFLKLILMCTFIIPLYEQILSRLCEENAVCWWLWGGGEFEELWSEAFSLSEFNVYARLLCIYGETAHTARTVTAALKFLRRNAVPYARQYHCYAVRRKVAGSKPMKWTIF